MRLCLIFCAVALAACSRPVEYIEVRPTVPADLLTPCEGWAGGPPTTEGDVLRIIAAEASGLACANGKLASVAQIVGPQ